MGSVRWPAAWVSVGLLLGCIGSVGVLFAVLLTLCSDGLWHRWAAGLKTCEVVEIDPCHLPGRLLLPGAVGEPAAGRERDYRLCDTAWVWVWRAVMLAAVLLFALPYTLPAREA